MYWKFGILLKRDCKKGVKIYFRRFVFIVKSRFVGKNSRDYVIFGNKVRKVVICKGEVWNIVEVEKELKD